MAGYIAGRNWAKADDGIGFIEIIVAIALMGLLAVLSLSSMRTYASRRDMLAAGRQLAGDLRLTQQLAVTQDQNFRLVYAPSSTSSYTIRRVSDNSISKDVLFPSTVTVTGTFAGNLAEFRPTGGPVQTGTFCVSSAVSTVMKVDVLAGTGRTTLQEVSTCP